jgi:hypothetical protein
LPSKICEIKKKDTTGLKGQKEQKKKHPQVELSFEKLLIDDMNWPHPRNPLVKGEGIV